VNKRAQSKQLADQVTKSLFLEKTRGLAFFHNAADTNVIVSKPSVERAWEREKMNQFAFGEYFTISHLLLLLVLELEGLDSTDAPKSSGLIDGALESEGDLLVDLCLSLLDRLLLSSETLLLHVVTSSSLRSGGFLTLLVLGDLVWSVGLALWAVCYSDLGITNHDC